MQDALAKYNPSQWRTPAEAGGERELMVCCIQNEDAWLFRRRQQLLLPSSLLPLIRKCFNSRENPRTPCCRTCARYRAILLLSPKLCAFFGHIRILDGAREHFARWRKDRGLGPHTQIIMPCVIKFCADVWKRPAHNAHPPAPLLLPGRGF